MHNSILPLSVSLLATQTLAAATLYLAGDSTCATWSSTSVIQGWGFSFPDYTTLTVSNQAVSGRSARSYTREGRFDTIASTVKSGDYVVMEFGHNDGGSLTTTDNGRSACGDASGVCQTTYNGVAETVYTYDAYLVNATKLLQAKGATVIISSQTPKNVFEGGTYAYTPGRFVGLAQKAATATGVTFVDHGLYVAQLYKNAGSATVNSYYPQDHTHTSPAGAKVVARAFALAVKASTSGLKGSLKGV